MSLRIAATVLFVLASFWPAVPVAQQTLTRGSNLSADAAADGRIVMDLAGDLWIVPAGGGEAARITENLKTAQRPRWSPDGTRIAYQAVADGIPGLFVHDLAGRQSERISRRGQFAMRPAWHPDGERLVYAADTTGEGFDLWEVDLPSGLHWRLSSQVGDETDAAWSADGRDLVYVHRQDRRWSLILRRHGLADEILLTVDEKIAGPSWRPDGSLITYMREGDSGRRIEMVILSEPRLSRTYADREAFTLAPVSWIDRQRMLYTAAGELRQRLFDAWRSRPLRFEATLKPDRPPQEAALRRRPLPRIDEPAGRLVIRAARYYDGIADSYQLDRDIVIESGRIAAIEPRRDQADAILIDMGDLTVLPGLIDTHGHLPRLATLYGEQAGPLLLASGVTTLVASHAESESLNALWSGKRMPGPRLLSRKDWSLSGVRSLADATTPGLPELLQSPQANLSKVSAPPARRYSEPLSLAGSNTAVILSSAENGLPAGIALHAELLAIVAAGLPPEQALKAAGVNAAAALKLDPFLGRIGVGAVADLVLVDGDPLTTIADARKVVAVVRNGRFFSVGGLVDRVQTVTTVE